MFPETFLLYVNASKSHEHSILNENHSLLYIVCIIHANGIDTKSFADIGIDYKTSVCGFG